MKRVLVQILILVLVSFVVLLTTCSGTGNKTQQIDGKTCFTNDQNEVVCVK